MLLWRRASQLAWLRARAAGFSLGPPACTLVCTPLGQQRSLALSSPPLLRPHQCTATDSAGPAPQPPKPVPKTWSVRPITKDDVDFSFSRSGGAGGQNVNKVSTKVDMRLDLAKADWIPYEIREQIRTAEKNRINNEGVLVVASQKHRTQAQNMDDALEKLQGMIDDAVKALTPTIADEETVKRVKAKIKAGNERRIQNKKIDSMKKKERSKKSWD